MLLTPKSHQLFEASHLLALPGKRGLLLAETGTGKTVTLGLIAQRLSRPSVWLTDKTLVIQTLNDVSALGLVAVLLEVPLERRRQELPEQEALLAQRLFDHLTEGPHS